MRVAHFISHFPYQSQFTDATLSAKYVCMGGEFAAYHLAANLTKQGHEILICTSARDGNDSIERYAGLIIYRYASFGQVGETRFSPGLNWRPLVDIQGVDIVHVHHTTPPGGLAGLICASVWKKPLLITHHGFEVPDYYGSLLRRFLVFLFAKFYVDYLFRKAAGLICISESYIESSIHLWKYLHKVTIIPNGVDLEEYNTVESRHACRGRLGLPAEKPIVLFMGSLVPRKGVDILLEAIRLVQNSIPDVQLIFVGQGPLDEKLKVQVGDFGLRANVHFPGFVAGSQEKNAYYRAADILVLPSRTEMFPLVLLEGFASGCAVVVSDLATFKNIVRPGQNGLTAQDGDPTSFAGRILELLRDPSRRERLSSEAVATAYQFSWPMVAKETSAVYDALVSGYRSSSWK